MRKEFYVTSFTNNIRLETYLGKKTQIALNEIAFKFLPNNIGSGEEKEDRLNNYVTFHLTLKITGGQRWLYKPVTVVLPTGRYETVNRMKEILQHEVYKHTSNVPGEFLKIFNNFLSRFGQKRGHHFIEEMRLKKNYIMSLDLGPNIQSFFNLPSNKLIIEKSSFFNEKPINFKLDKIVSVYCEEIDNNIISGDLLKNVSIKDVDRSSNVVHYQEIEQLEFKSLKAQCFRELNFRTASYIKVIYYTCKIISSD